MNVSAQLRRVGFAGIRTLVVVLAVGGVTPAQIRIPAIAEVQAATVYLSQLVPSATPPRIRAAAERIPLGSAPQLGATREIPRDALVSAIAAAGLSPAEFTIPPVVTVHRDGRLIAREEIFAAIQSALTRNPAADFPHLEPGNFNLMADVHVPSGDAGLEVTQMEFDPLINRMRFRLWPKKAPGVLPFFVTAQVTGPAPQPPRASGSVSSSTSLSNLQPSPPKVVLVSPAQPARLHIHSANLDMLLAVRPLQRGYLNDVVRVRLLGSGRILRARVAGVAYLDATL